VRQDLKDQPELLAHQLEAIGLAYETLDDLGAARSVLDESLRLRRQVYGDDHPLVARGLANLATVLYRTGETARAAELYEEAIAIRRRLGQPEKELAKAESGMAANLMQVGDFDAAEKLYRRLLKTRLEAYGSDSPDVANTQRSLGILFYLRGDFDGAEPWLRQALDVREQAFGRENTETASALSSLGRLLTAQGRRTEAEEALTECLAVRRRLLGDDHLHVALTRNDLADLYFDLGEDAVAQVLRDQAMAVLRAEKPADSWEIADAESRLGARLAAEGRLDEAEPCLVDSYETLRRLRGEEAIYTREAKRRLEDFFGSGRTGLRPGGTDAHSPWFQPRVHSRPVTPPRCAAPRPDASAMPGRSPAIRRPPPARR
jgi:tetratricopeptide (TPR) repeat protein